MLWGFDREMFSDRYLISRLEPRVPARARESFMRLKEASTSSWAQRETNPGTALPLCGGSGGGVGRSDRVAQRRP